MRHQFILFATAAALVSPAAAGESQSAGKWNSAETTAMIAVTRVFSSRYPLGMSRGGIDLQALAHWEASVGDGLVLRRVGDQGCSFRLEKASDGSFIAGIDLSHLSGEYEINGAGRLMMEGQGAAVCDYSGRVGQITCYSHYLSGPIRDGARLADLVRAFRYLYSNLCTPVDLPVR